MAEVIVRIVPKCATERVSLWRLRRAVRFLKKTLIGAKSDDVFCNGTNRGAKGDDVLRFGVNVAVHSDKMARNGNDVGVKGGNVLRGDVTAREVDYKRYKNVEFIDCGANLESISCPNCGEEINFSWWGEAMNKSYETLFKEMGVMTPCCNKKTTLGGLKYNAPCSFAKTEIRVFDPQDLIPEETIHAIERICKTPFQVIYQRV